MEKTPLLRLIPAYLRRRLLGIVAFLLFALLFALVFFLYALPLEAVGYAALLCLLAGLPLTLWGFARFVGRHRQLEMLRSRITLGLDGLPASRNLLEQDYQQLLTLMQEDKVRQITLADQAASELLDYFTLWAHQIKTPIAAMRLLLQTGEGGQRKELTEELFRTEQYVEMVLSYIRVNSRTTDWVFRRYDLDEIIRQAVRKYAPLFVRKKLRLAYEPVHAQVLTDEKWLLFALEQLLSNALKYTATGEIAIRLEEPKTLVIADTGIGIAPEDLPRVFEKGFTGYNGRADKKSTGIGLYLVRQILGKLSHPVTIFSTPGRGTEVRIDLADKPRASD